MKLHSLAANIICVLALTGCQGGDVIVIDDNDGANYNPVIHPGTFSSRVDHPLFTLAPGRSWTYEGVNDEGKVERIVIEVTADTKTVMGVSTIVVRDRVWENGEIVEDTLDWFAEDREGNVWYFGEEVNNYEDGVLADHEGSWEAGVNGAKPGIVMKATPTVGDTYRQEFLAGEAEDMGEILATGVTVTTSAGSFDGCIVTEDWTPLDPSVVENKYYCPGVGNMAIEEKVAGAAGRVELVEMKN